MNNNSMIAESAEFVNLEICFVALKFYLLPKKTSRIVMNREAYHQAGFI